jgi:HEPN domain-containing protein
MDQNQFELWFSEAENDFETGEILINSYKYNNAVFNFIQAAEKAIKAILYYLNVKAWGHSIINLIIVYENLGYTIDEKFKKIGRELENHYLTSRYPDASPKIAPKDAYDEKIALEIKTIAQEFIQLIKNEKKHIDSKKEGTI